MLSNLDTIRHLSGELPSDWDSSFLKSLQMFPKNGLPIGKHCIFTSGSLRYRLQDTRNNLKKRRAVQEKQSREEIQSLTNKYKRLVQQYKDVQKRIR